MQRRVQQEAATLDGVAELDAADPLAGKRGAFRIPDGVIYLDGNSLGPVPHAALAALRIAAEDEWGTGLIRSWNAAGWFSAPGRLGDRIGRLIGAKPGETVVTDSISVNLYKVLHAAMNLRPGRRAIVAEADAFPTDLYIAEGVASVRAGVQIRLAGVDGPSLAALVDDDVAAVLINHVNYRTGEVQDMASLTAAVHRAGALAVWDLAHSAGAMPVDLAGASADFAVGCTYKYLNGGPGAPAFVMAATRHHGQLRQPLTGWWGHARPFAFERGYRAGDGMAPMLCGTAPMLAMRALEGALDVWDDVDLGQLRAKSLALTDLFMQRIEQRCGGHGLSIVAPRDHIRRGSQVSLRHPEGYAIMQALIARNVIGDFRAPDFMRFGFSPLYLSYRDVWDAVETLRDILETGAWRAAAHQVRTVVT